MGFIARERVGVDQVARLGRERGVQRDEVGLAQGARRGRRRGRRAGRPCRSPRRAARRRGRCARRRRSPASRRDSSSPSQPCGSHVCQSPARDVGVRLGQAARGGEQQREGEVGGRVGEHVGRDADGDAALRRRRRGRCCRSRRRSWRSPAGRARRRAGRRRRGRSAARAGPRRRRRRSRSSSGVGGRSPGQTSTSCSAARRFSPSPGSRRVTKQRAIARIMPHALAESATAREQVRRAAGDATGRCVRASRRSAARVERVHGVDAEPAQRLGLPGARERPDPRQRGQLGLAAEDQVAQRAPGEVRGADALADVAAGPRLAAGAVEADGGQPVARDAEHAVPARGDADAAQGREQLDEAVAQLARGARGQRGSRGSCPTRRRRGRRGRRSRRGRRRCAAGRRSGCGRRAASRRSCQRSAASRSGSSWSVTIIELVIGSSLPAQPRQVGAVALRGADDDGRAHAARGGADDAVAPAGHAAALVDRRPGALGGRGEADAPGARAARGRSAG